MEQHLDAVVFLVLDWIEAHVELGEQLEVLDVPELQYFLDFVQAQVEEPQVSDEFQSTQVSDLVSREIQRAQERCCIQSLNLLDVVTS